MSSVMADQHSRRGQGAGPRTSRISETGRIPLSLVKMLSGLNAFGISNTHEWEFEVRSVCVSDVTMLRLAKIRRKEFLRTTARRP
jgi:hypothetical protein